MISTGLAGFVLNEYNGIFMHNDDYLPAPPVASLKKLEAPCKSVENTEASTDEKWMKDLIAPGSSIGGARPMAVVKDGKTTYSEIPKP